MSYNKIILQGNLVREIEIKYSAGGMAIGKTSIAVNHKFKSKTGESKEDVLFVDLNFFGRTAEILNQYCRKGSKVLIDGTLKLDQWTAADGSKRSKHSVAVTTLQMLDAKGEVDNSRTDTDRYAEQPAPIAAPQNNMDDPNRHNVAGAMNKPAHHQTVPGSNIPLEITEDSIPF